MLNGEQLSSAAFANKGGMILEIVNQCTQQCFVINRLLLDRRIVQDFQEACGALPREQAQGIVFRLVGGNPLPFHPLSGIVGFFGHQYNVFEKVLQAFIGKVDAQLQAGNTFTI